MTAIRTLPHKLAPVIGSAFLILVPFARAQLYQQFNLVTDDQSANSAKIQDPSLVNAWGVSFGPSTPFWVSDNGSGVSTLYSVNPINNTPTKVGLTVNTGGAGNPTGQAFNPQAGAGAFNSDPFLFVAEDGTISGWRGALGTTAEILQTGDTANVYKGTTIDTVGGHEYLLSANFRAGTIDVVKGDNGAPNLTGKFNDPNLPSGFAPFNIRELAGKIYVTYAMQDSAKHDDVAGAGLGFVTEFDLQGNLITRIGTQGTLNSPWGLEIAPPEFGPNAGDLLVGNFGDGTINVFDPNGGGFKGQLLGPDGKPVSIDGLWALTVGNNGSGGSSDKLYFSAGPNGENDGLFGLVLQVPDAGSTLILLAMSLSGMAVCSRASKSSL
jgi:uncharacterized protein (TIGR03118 family)